MEPQQTNANCSNIYCFSCLSKQINTMLRNVSTIQCQSCHVVVDPDVYRDMIPPYLYTKWKTVIENIDQNNDQIIPATEPISHNTAPNPTRPLEELFARILLTNLVHGESSDEEVPEEEFNCNICLEKKSVIDISWVKSCNHFFCINCLRGYISVKVEAREIPIKCPDPDCQDGVLELEMCKEIVPRDVFDKWDDELCEDALGDKKYYCPFANCALLLFDERAGHRLVARDKCPHCQRDICTKCNVPWHNQISCEDFQKLGPDERGRDDILIQTMAAESHWKRCPECKMYVEKTTGCRKITCRCGNAFCYECGNNMPKSGHKCVTCNWEI